MKKVVWLGPLALVAGFALLPRAETSPTLGSEVNYDRDIRPILSDKCFKCHGPSAAQVAAGLRLDLEKEATKDRGGYKVVAPGNPGDSALMARVTTKTDAMRMPPASSGKPKLTNAEIDLLKRWIAQGAKYQDHWSFVTPQLPKLPKVSDPSWVKNSIDAFVLAGLDAKGMKPEPTAPKPTLIRRVALTLTGLPPTPDEVDKFLADKSATAYENMVDRYLASKRYGEHQARFWLDAVRYGDTHGLHLDNERNIYPYRDWVVRAYNDDLPFNDFTVWQLAGDLLPNPTTDQMVATGYIRMNPTTNEGGAIEEEFLAKNTFDRVDTTSTIFMGMTVGCARCHDHKFDPISHKDYYQLYAFLNSTVDKPFDGNELLPAPVMRAPNPDEDKALKSMRAQLTRLESEVDVAQADSWIATARVEPPTLGPWEVSPPYAAANFEEAFAKEFGPEPGGVADPGGWKPLALKVGEAIQVIGKENSAGYVRVSIKMEKERDFEFRVGSDDGIRIWLNGTLVHDNKVLRGVTQGSDPVKVHLIQGSNEVIFKVVNGGGPDALSVDLGDPSAKRMDAVFQARKKKEGESDLRKAYLELGPETSTSKRYRSVVGAITKMEANIPMTLIAQELPKPRPAFILKRGEYNLPTLRVERRLPAIFGNLPKGAPKNRLGLAKWVVDPNNPLTTRVFANRVWQQHFGTGIVKTAEDFGNQGDWPSHPELLDYLAVKFVKEGWSLKRLHRLILTSNAYRQSATVSAFKHEKDPENRLISRGPRFRLDAEVIRDQALWTAGLLQIQEGGRGFKPYQPDGLWETIAFVESTTSIYTRDMDSSIYRRSLYLFWKRTSPHPTMLTFDAPMRESCTVRRSRTNTPLQALVTLNEPAYLEASRVFAQRLAMQKRTEAQKLTTAFRIALGRNPKPQEAQLLLKAKNRYHALYAKNPGAATELIKIGDSPIPEGLNHVEIASWMLVTSTLMNTDEFLTQH